MGRQIFIACDTIQQQHDSNEPTIKLLFDQGQELSLIGFQRAAGCILRQALTLGLIDLCFKYGVWPRNQRTGKKLKESDVDHCVKTAVYCLDTAGMFSAEQRDAMLRAIDLGNSAAHRKPIRRADVTEMVAMVELIYSRVKGYTSPVGPNRERMLESKTDEPIIVVESLADCDPQSDLAAKAA